MTRYESNYCYGCASGESLTLTMPNSLAGGFPVHEPSHAICTKYVQPYYVKGESEMVKHHGKPAPPRKPQPKKPPKY